MTNNKTFLENRFGVAIDSPETTSYHQIINCSTDTDNGKYKIDFSVFYMPLNQNVNRKLPNGFIDMYCCKTPRNKYQIRRMQFAYSNFIESIRPYNKKTAFTLNQPAKAICYELSFNHHYKLEDFSVKPVLATMTAAYDAKTAKSKAFSDPVDQSLKDFYLVLSNYHATSKSRCLLDQHNISFTSMMCLITDVISKNLVEYARKNEHDLVYRIDPRVHITNLTRITEEPLDSYHVLRQHCPQYGSILKAEQCENKKGIESNAMARIPSTAARKHIDIFNLDSLFGYLMNGGRNPYPEGTALAIANYERHIQSWRYGL